jgi:hypothetical protein
MFIATDGPAFPPGIFRGVIFFWFATIPHGQPPMRA